MENSSYETAGPAGCGTPLKACAVLTVIILAAIIGMLLWISRTPKVQDIMGCRMHLTEIGSAIERYRDVNGVYPENLTSLQDEYLKDTSVLTCPTAKAKGLDGQYTYHRPKPESPGSFIMLECRLHRISPDTKPIILTLKKNGKIEVIANKGK